MKPKLQLAPAQPKRKPKPESKPVPPALRKTVFAVDPLLPQSQLQAWKLLLSKGR